MPLTSISKVSFIEPAALECLVGIDNFFGTLSLATEADFLIMKDSEGFDDDFSCPKRAKSRWLTVYIGNGMRYFCA